MLIMTLLVVATCIDPATMPASQPVGILQDRPVEPDFDRIRPLNDRMEAFARSINDVVKTELPADATEAKRNSVARERSDQIATKCSEFVGTAGVLNATVVEVRQDRNDASTSVAEVLFNTNVAALPARAQREIDWIHQRADHDCQNIATLNARRKTPATPEELETRYAEIRRKAAAQADAIRNSVRFDMPNRGWITGPTASLVDLARGQEVALRVEVTGVATSAMRPPSLGDKPNFSLKDMIPCETVFVLRSDKAVSDRSFVTLRVNFKLLAD